jgi:hypothetical protein
MVIEYEAKSEDCFEFIFSHLIPQRYFGFRRRELSGKETENMTARVPD